ncbi:MAG: hypothetical protein CMN32_16970 [Saprospirales bacterium]|nr:hypothetical protein [Saprospirales bacterium]
MVVGCIRKAAVLNMTWLSRIVVLKVIRLIFTVVGYVTTAHMEIRRYLWLNVNYFKILAN